MSSFTTLTSDSHSPRDIAIDASEVTENNLQPFLVLHKASSRKCERASSSASRGTKRKIDTQPSSPSSAMQEENDAVYEQLRLKAFEKTWPKIDSAVKEVLREINNKLFEEIRQCVFESFSAIRSTSPVHITKPYSIVKDPTCKRIPTALVFTKNIEFVDDLLMFQDLKGYMESNGCHAAILSASDISIKHGIGNCLRSLCKQLVSEVPDVADVPLIASWYCDSENYNKPIVIIIDDMGRCDGAILADFIKMLSEWAMKIPIIFILGVTTSFDALTKHLPSSVLHNLQTFKFTLDSPERRMDSLIESVLVRSCFGFFIGHKVALFLRNHFLKHDGTIALFLKALKLACVKHFMEEPLSFLCPGMLYEDCEAFWTSKCGSLTEVLQSYARNLPSCQSGETIQVNNLAHELSVLKWLHDCWSSVVLCLFEVGKISKIKLFDILCEAMDPCLPSKRDLSLQMLQPLTLSHERNAKTSFVNGGFISQAIQNVRELSSESLRHLLGQWSLHMEKIIELLLQMDSEVKLLFHSTINLSSDGHTSEGKCVPNIPRLSASSEREKGTSLLFDETATLLICMLRKFLVPIESVPFHEIFCFKSAASLKSALIGDPRRVVQDDLLKLNGYLKSTFPGSTGCVSYSFTHDTAIMYRLAQEYGELINLHDWYHSFKTKVMIPLNTKAKCKGKHSPASKKVKPRSAENEATIQARFCRAVIELQITGLLRMPSKRRPDFVQRVVIT